MYYIFTPVRPELCTYDRLGVHVPDRLGVHVPVLQIKCLHLLTMSSGCTL